MEPVSYQEARTQYKQLVAPMADESCKHCGLWRVKIMQHQREEWQCAIDNDYRYCEGRCSQYKPKLSIRMKRLFHGSRREQTSSVDV